MIALTKEELQGEALALMQRMESLERFVSLLARLGHDPAQDEYVKAEYSTLSAWSDELEALQGSD